MVLPSPGGLSMAYSPTGFYRTVDANILTPPVEVTSTPWASETGVRGAHYPNIRKTGVFWWLCSRGARQASRSLPCFRVPSRDVPAAHAAGPCPRRFEESRQSR